VRRLEGAKRELSQSTGVQTSAPPPESSAPPKAADVEDVPPEREPPASHPSGRGRLDGATLVTGAVALGATGTGIFFGIRALSDRPTHYVLGVDGDYAAFARQNDDAHREAVVADVAFAVGLLAAGLAAYLFFGRTEATPTASIVVPALGGDGASVEGRF
jgi:hypothetical protein